MRFYTDERFWHPRESRFDNRKTELWIKLYVIRPPAPGFERDVVRVLHVPKPFARSMVRAFRRRFPATA